MRGKQDQHLWTLAVRLCLGGLVKIHTVCARSQKKIVCHCNKWIPPCLWGKWKPFTLSGFEQPGVICSPPWCHLSPISLYKGWWIRGRGGGKPRHRCWSHKNDKVNSLSTLMASECKEDAWFFFSKTGGFPCWSFSPGGQSKHEFQIKSFSQKTGLMIHVCFSLFVSVTLSEWNRTWFVNQTNKKGSLFFK